METNEAVFIVKRLFTGVLLNQSLSDVAETLSHSIVTESMYLDTLTPSVMRLIIFLLGTLCAGWFIVLPQMEKLFEGPEPGKSL
jgi:hypothetical protein